ncbi:MAG TPA: LptF/LptG family permease [Deltaproteobacteria bacterium]|nr:LptF/LptG family permease [Deltaproteobacteria bacterium]
MFKKSAFMCIAALTGLVLLILVSRFFGNLSSYAEHNTDLYTILMHTLFSIPQIMYWVLPFSVCLGILATQAALSRHVEVIAMQACSVSTYRIFLPYVIVGLLATLIMSALSFYVYPVAQRNADRLENIYIKKRDIEGSFSVSGGRFKVGGDIYFVEHLDIERGIMQNITCYRMTSGRLTSVIHAQAARWNDATWKADGIEVIDMGEKGITVDQSATTLPLARGPADLVMAQTDPEVLSIDDLRQYLNQLELNGIVSPTVETVFHSRISFTISPFIMTILVLPFGMRFPRAGGIARGISIGLVLGLTYWFFHSGMTSLGASGILGPILASWLANIVALCLGLILFFTRRSTYG